MVLLAVFTPLLNFLVFAIFSSFVHRTQLARLVIASMVSLLIVLIANLPGVMAGYMKTVSYAS